MILIVQKDYPSFYQCSLDLRPPGSGSVIICTNPNPNPSINKQKKTLRKAVSTNFVISNIRYFLSLMKCTYRYSNCNKKTYFFFCLLSSWKPLKKRAGSAGVRICGSGSKTWPPDQENCCLPIYSPKNSWCCACTGAGTGTGLHTEIKDTVPYSTVPLPAT